VQRITKYQLLLREALRLTERTRRLSEIEGLRAAAHVMRVIPKAANDMMDVGRLQGFDVRSGIFAPLATEIFFGGSLARILHDLFIIAIIHPSRSGIIYCILLPGV
jgi:hypothetical protein